MVGRYGGPQHRTSDFNASVVAFAAPSAVPAAAAVPVAVAVVVPAAAAAAAAAAVAVVPQCNWHIHPQSECRESDLRDRPFSPYPCSCYRRTAYKPPLDVL